MRVHVLDRRSGCLHPGPTGLNFSSYLRDYDFRILLPRLMSTQATPQEWEAFGSLQAQFFMPQGLPAPLAFYSSRALQEEMAVYLGTLVAVMANFQRICRPEIYLSRTSFSHIPGEVSKAYLSNQDFEPPALLYDWREREQLANQQAQLIEDCLIKDHAEWLEEIVSARIDAIGAVV